MIITILYFLFWGTIALTLIYLLTKAYKVSKKVVKRATRARYVWKIDKDNYRNITFTSYYQAKAFCEDMNIELKNIYQEEETYE